MTSARRARDASMPDERALEVAFYVPWVARLVAADRMALSGGAEHQVIMIGRALAKRGIGVTFSSFDIPGVVMPKSFDGVKVALRPPHFGGRGALGAFRELLATTKAVADLAAPVLVTTIAGPHVGITGAVAKLRRRRFIYYAASVTDFEFFTRAPNLRDRFLHWLGLRLADEIVVQTNEQASLCRRRLGRDSTVIKNIAEASLSGERRPEAFLWAGRVTWYKNPLAYVDLARAVPGARFWMVAAPNRESGDLFQTLEEAAGNLPNLTLIPALPRDDLLALMDRAVAVVNTSSFEGMPNVTLEGWSRGVPALTLAHDPDALIVERGLGVFAGGSPDDLAAGARKLWTDRADQNELSERCRRYVADEHSESVIAGRWATAVGSRLVS